MKIKVHKSTFDVNKNNHFKNIISILELLDYFIYKNLLSHI